MTEHGPMASCTGKGSTFGPMARSTLAFISKASSQAKAKSSFPTERNLEASLRMARFTAPEFLFPRRADRRDITGKMESATHIPATQALCKSKILISIDFLIAEYIFIILGLFKNKSERSYD